jgi:hypothetical protein
LKLKIAEKNPLAKIFFARAFVFKSLVADWRTLLGHIVASPWQPMNSLQDSKSFDKNNWKNFFSNLSKLQMKLFKSQKNENFQSQSSISKKGLGRNSFFAS